jgi:hypothetical protein
MNGGRKTVWNEELEKKVIDMVSIGTNLATVARECGIGYRTIMDHKDNCVVFRSALTRAQEDGAAYVLEKAENILADDSKDVIVQPDYTLTANNAAVTRAKERANYYKYYAGFLNHRVKEKDPARHFPGLELCKTASEICDYIVAGVAASQISPKEADFLGKIAELKMRANEFEQMKLRVEELEKLLGKGK